MFIILPQVFENMGGMASVLGFVFFILVLFAALTSSISLVETCTSIISDGTKCSRRRALVIVIRPFTTIMGIVVNMGYSSLSFIQPLGEGSSILDFLDFVSNSVMMPIAALLTCVFVGWIIGPKVVIDEVRESAKFKLAGVWTVMVKYIAPVVLVVILVGLRGADAGVVLHVALAGSRPISPALLPLASLAMRRAPLDGL